MLTSVKACVLLLFWATRTILQKLAGEHGQERGHRRGRQSTKMS